MPDRVEHDSLGERAVPAEAYYGIQTVRALENYPISGLRAPADFVTALVLVKRAAARVNGRLALLDSRVAHAIVETCDEILAGGLRGEFVVDLYQAGAGTSLHMNVNEVVANRAAERLGGARGRYDVVHPNDHVNRGQSTNDVFPTATRLALLMGLSPMESAVPAVGRRDGCVAVARELSRAFEALAVGHAATLRVGRTHLQDAVPMTFGQAFGGYAAALAAAADGVAQAAERLHELNLGGTAVGTGLNAPPTFAAQVVEQLRDALGLPLRPADNFFRVTQSMGDVLAVSGALRRLAIDAGKVASDLRLLSSGPRAGLAEVRLPAVQPGSSIMPGKVNPSIPEMVNQVVYQVIGCDVTVAAACDAGQLELNVMMPVIAWNALHAVTILREALRAFCARTVRGLGVDAERAAALLHRSTAVATALSPRLGYARTAEIVEEALARDLPVAEVVVERGWLTPDEVARLLDPARVAHEP